MRNQLDLLSCQPNFFFTFLGFHFLTVQTTEDWTSVLVFNWTQKTKTHTQTHTHNRIGFSILSPSYYVSFFMTLKKWGQNDKKEENTIPSKKDTPEKITN